MRSPPPVDEHVSDDEPNVHHVWNNELEPVRSVEPGIVLQFTCRDALDGQIQPGATADDFAEVSFDPVHPLTGPIEVRGASPGDVLVVDIIELEHEGWGFTGYLPGEMEFGLLPDEFPEAGVHIWDLEGDVAHFVDGIEVPLDPFPGIVGVAPAAAGDFDTLPPRRVGGNMDIKHLTAGSRLYLPVEVAGALFSIGDCHAAQGDGEVCVTGIEAPMTVTARLDLRSDMTIEQPQFETTGPFTPTGADEPMYGTTGISDDLMEATKRAVLHMIDHLESRHGLSRGMAYILCSAAIDLKINEVVDAPNWVVSAYLPASLFPET